MSHALTILTPDTLGEFMSSPLVVLVLSKRDCAACADWTVELEDFLSKDEEWTDFRFGKLFLDQRGLIDFKRANPWLAEVDNLPFNSLFKDGSYVKGFPGSGVTRLTNRLRRLRD